MTQLDLRPRGFGSAPRYEALLRLHGKVTESLWRSASSAYMRGGARLTMRTGDVEDVAIAHAYLRIAADVAGLIHDEKAAELGLLEAVKAACAAQDRERDRVAAYIPSRFRLGSRRTDGLPAWQDDRRRARFIPVRPAGKSRQDVGPAAERRPRAGRTRARGRFCTKAARHDHVLGRGWACISAGAAVLMLLQTAARQLRRTDERRSPPSRLLSPAAGRDSATLPTSGLIEQEDLQRPGRWRRGQDGCWRRSDQASARLGSN